MQTADKLQISLAAARVNADMTQEAVARQLRVSKQTIISWEKGKTNPSFSTLKALSDIYQIPIDSIFLPSASHLSEAKS